ncbi:hypothetical protein [Pseudonocardia sp.]|uniref:hypothetical protein n=1 Tax=Pseudonocardia sp. TaxID=60912 RepID=UPI0034560DAE
MDDYQVSKQADVLMLFYLLSADELRVLLGGLGYPLPPDSIRRTIDHYLARTVHGSTLSALVHAWVLARAHREDALSHFERALSSDLADIQGGTTAEGVHLGAMAGCVDLLQRCFAGVETRENAIWFNPHWPSRSAPSSSWSSTGACLSTCGSPAGRCGSPRHPDRARRCVWGAGRRSVPCSRRRPCGSRPRERRT